MQGTNGGVTKLGLFASLTGGLFIGLVFWAAVLVSPSLRLHTGAFDSALRQWPVIWLGELHSTMGIDNCNILHSLLCLIETVYRSWQPRIAPVPAAAAVGEYRCTLYCVADSVLLDDSMHTWSHAGTVQ